jgi:hypothetical protein
MLGSDGAGCCLTTRHSLSVRRIVRKSQRKRRRIAGSAAAPRALAPRRARVHLYLFVFNQGANRAIVLRRLVAPFAALLARPLTRGGETAGEPAALSPVTAAAAAVRVVDVDADVAATATAATAATYRVATVVAARRL